MTGPYSPTREDILLLVADGANGTYPLDPIRLMKGAFLVSKRGRPEWRSLFSFEPFDYGPFDKAVYVSRDTLLAQGLLLQEFEGRYATYAVSEAGAKRVAALEGELGEENANWLRSIGEFVTQYSFSALLKGIYEIYPEYAARSIARV